jgi:hypothetical protein
MSKKEIGRRMQTPPHPFYAIARSIRWRAVDFGTTKTKRPPEGGL